MALCNFGIFYIKTLIARYLEIHLSYRLDIYAQIVDEI